MVRINAIAVVGCLVSLPLASAQRIEKPFMWKNLNEVIPKVEQVLPRAKYTITEMKRGVLTERCVEEAKDPDRQISNLQDVTGYRVKFEDCDDEQGWAVCRHKDFPQSLDNFLHFLSQIPVGFRQYTGEILLLPNGKGRVAQAGSGIAWFFDKVGFGTILHEFTHNVDSNGGFELPKNAQGGWKPGDGSYSSSDDWKLNVGKDKKLVDEWARTSYAEAWASLPAVALYDYFIAGGIGTFAASVGTNANDIIYQYHTIRHQSYHSRHGIDLLRHRGKCSYRPQISKEVQAFTMRGSSVLVSENVVAAAAASRHGHHENETVVVEEEGREFEARRVRARELYNITLGRLPVRRAGEAPVHLCNLWTA